MIQLNPMIPLTYEGRLVHAMLVLDYSQEHDTLMLCAFNDTKELWWLPTYQLRAVENVSMGRPGKRKP